MNDVGLLPKTDFGNSVRDKRGGDRQSRESVFYIDRRGRHRGRTFRHDRAPCLLDPSAFAAGGTWQDFATTLDLMFMDMENNLRKWGSATWVSETYEETHEAFMVAPGPMATPDLNILGYEMP